MASLWKHVSHEFSVQNLTGKRPDESWFDTLKREVQIHTDDKRKRQRADRRRVIWNRARHLWKYGPHRAPVAEEGAEKPAPVDYWVWDHWMAPFWLYYFLRSVFIAAFIDWFWEVVERGSYILLGYFLKLDPEHPETWPDSFRPESAFNSIINDMLNGLHGILYCKAFVWALAIPRVRGLLPYTTDAETVAQLLFIIVAGAMSGMGIKELYFFGLLENMVFIFISHFWNHNAARYIYPTVGVSLYALVAASLGNQVPPYQPIFTLSMAIVLLWPFTILYGIIHHYA